MFAARRRIVVWLVTLVTLGSGLLNLASVIGPSLRERRLLLRQVFPLEFLSVSRFLTLLIGFALVISSLNVRKRKKRAHRMVLLLACGSVVFHMTKGLDYEEALFSLLLVALLVATRRWFTVESAPPDLAGGLVRLSIAALVAFLYGVFGFWLLDPGQFGINFRMPDALHRTLLFLSLAGDPTVVPHTRYAHWFIDSLYVTTITAMVYSGFALFRPVIYRYATHPHEVDLANELLRKFGRTAIDFYKTWPDKSLFFSASRRAFLAYSVGGNFAVVLGDPVGPEEEIAACLSQFLEHCRHNDWGLGFHQVLPDFLPLYRKLGLKKLKIGDEAIVDLAGFTLTGKKAREARRTIKLEQEGVHTRLFYPPLPEDVLSEARQVSSEWLSIPGRRERQFSLGRFEPYYVRSTPLLAAYDPRGRMLAWVNLVSSFHPGEATIDLMRRRSEAPNGIMDYLFIKLFLYNREKGFTRFSLGLAPMAGFQEKEEARPEEKAVHFFFQRLNFLFSYKGLRDYKAKFASSWEPRYEIYRHVRDLPRLAIALQRVSEVQE